MRKRGGSAILEMHRNTNLVREEKYLVNRMWREEMRDVSAVLLSMIVVGMLIVPAAVSAGTTSVIVPDNLGDVARHYDSACYPANGAGNAPILQAQYVDMTSLWLSQKGGSFAFGMTLAGALPLPGEALPGGVKYVRWVLWIDPKPTANNTAPLSLYSASLKYDGISYSAGVRDYATGVMTPTIFAVDGAQLSVSVPGCLIGNLGSFYWSEGVVVDWGAGWAPCVDLLDPGSVSGQLWWDAPWPVM